MINKLYCLTHDIDWFCFFNGIPIHIASNGGDLPHFFSKRKLSLQRSYVSQLPLQNPQGVNIIMSKDLQHHIEQHYSYLSQILEDKVLNPDFQELFSTGNAMDLYTRSFKLMAAKGFFSMDRVINEDGTCKYYMIAQPSHPLHFEEMPNNIFPIISMPEIELFDEPVDLVELINRYYE